MKKKSHSNGQFTKTIMLTPEQIKSIDVIARKLEKTITGVERISRNKVIQYLIDKE